MKAAGPDATESEIRTLLGGFGITGEAADPDLLERIFSRFCIGK